MNAEEEDRCEFESPELVTDYWPVFLDDPLEQPSGDYPVIDLVIGRNGKPMGVAPVGKFNDLELDVLSIAGKMLEFTPAIACGEIVESFDRHIVDTYFFVTNQDRGNITVPPVTRFLITSDLYHSLSFLTLRTEQREILVDMVLGKDGKLRDMKAADEVGEFVLKSYLEPLNGHFDFVPAQRDGQPVDVAMKLRMRLKGWAGGRTLAGFNLDKVNKPMPRKPANDSVEIGKVFSVQMNFDERGVMWGLQYLTVMNEAESLAAMNAFRNWTIGASTGENRFFRKVVVRYVFNEETDTADLLEEISKAELHFARPLKRPAPEYPREFRREGRSGYVVIEFTINEKGRTESPKVIFTSAPEFADAALKALVDWKFKPATISGEPTTVRIRVPIPFIFHP